MSVSSLSFSATLPPFYYTSGYNTNFSGTNASLSGNLLLTSNTDSNGFTSTNISSTVNSNGTSYNETGASLNGNKLTVNYQTDSTDLSTLTNANINGAGVGFSPTGATASGNSLTTNYATNPNGAFGETVQGAAVSTGIGSQNIQLESVATVGNSLTVTFDVGGAPVSTTTLAPATAPQSSAPTPPVFAGANSPGANFSSRGIMTIGELLANGSGLTLNGTLTNAAQSQSGTGQSTATPDEALILASTLNPAINLSPDQNIQVTDFVNTGLDAFPTTAPDQANTINTANNDANSNNDTFANGANIDTGTSTNGANNTIADQNGFSNSGNDGSTSNVSAFSQSTGIYSAVANASSSNILGGNFNGVA